MGTSFGKQVYLAGRQIWSEDTSGSGKFLFQDHLGSTRITADAAGNLKDDIDYLPFGEIEANFGTASDIHYQFTGYESDIAEDSTAYATFRNLSVSMGRFHRPDPDDGSYDPTDPQSFNRYSYTRNSPTIFVDPFGLNEMLYGQDFYDNNGCLRSGYDETILECPSQFSIAPNPGSGQTTGGGAGSSAPSNGPTPNPCQAKLLNMANQQLGTNFNSSNVAGSYINGTAYNIIIQSNQLTAAQFNNIQQGRYTTSGWQYLTGVGLAGHIADETNLGFAQSAFQSSNIGGNLSVSFAFHDDHGYANNPIGALIHWITDVLGHNTRKPC